MIAIYLAPLYLLVCAYILFRSIHWIRVLHAAFSECVGVQGNRSCLSFCCVQYSDCIYGAGFWLSEIYETSE